MAITLKSRSSRTLLDDLKNGSHCLVFHLGYNTYSIERKIDKYRYYIGKDLGKTLLKELKPVCTKGLEVYYG